MSAGEEQIKIYYDGTCRICAGTMRKIEASSRHGRFAPIDVYHELPNHLDRNAALHDMHVIEGGKTYRGAGAVMRILEEYPRWRWLAWLGRLPVLRNLAAGMYRLIADHRHRL